MLEGRVWFQGVRRERESERGRGGRRGKKGVGTREAYKKVPGDGAAKKEGVQSLARGTLGFPTLGPVDSTVLCVVRYPESTRSRRIVKLVVCFTCGKGTRKPKRTNMDYSGASR